MAFKRSAVRSRLSPPQNTGFHHEIRCFSYFLFFHLTFFYHFESLSGKQTTAVRSRLSPPQNTAFLNEMRCFSNFMRLFQFKPDSGSALGQQMGQQKPQKRCECSCFCCGNGATKWHRFRKKSKMARLFRLRSRFSLAETIMASKFFAVKLGNLPQE